MLRTLWKMYCSSQSGSHRKSRSLWVNSDRLKSWKATSYRITYLTQNQMIIAKQIDTTGMFH